VQYRALRPAHGGGMRRAEAAALFKIPPPALALADTVEEAVLQPTDKTGLMALIGRLDPVKLTARRAFVAYNGVLSVIFDGWPPQVEMLQSELTDHLALLHQGHELADTGLVLQAHTGTLFPKTSLGALCDGCKLSAHEFQAVDEVCVRFGAGFELLLDTLSYTKYADRRLRAIIADTEMDLAEDAASIGAPGNEVSKEGRALTAKILAETKQPEYLEKVNAEGHRINHYKERALGSTVVGYWDRAVGDGVAMEWVGGLRAAVDAAAPGKYKWFKDQTLHVSIRAIWEARTRKHPHKPADTE
jgi:hypothetical protein